MSQDPREAWRRLQQSFQQAQSKGFGAGGGGPPRGALGGTVALIALVGGGILFNNALFNGELTFGLNVIVKRHRR